MRPESFHQIYAHITTSQHSQPCEAKEEYRYDSQLCTTLLHHDSYGRAGNAGFKDYRTLAPLCVLDAEGVIICPAKPYGSGRFAHTQTQNLRPTLQTLQMPRPASEVTIGNKAQYEISGR